MIRKLGICQGCSQNNREEKYRDKLFRGRGGGGPRAAQMSPWGEVYNIHQLPYPSRQAHVCEKLDSHSSPIVDLTHNFTCLIALKDLSFVARHCQ